MPSRRLPRLLPLAAALLAACGQSGGCSGVEPTPGGFQGSKVNNAAVLRISKAGFDYLNANWKQLISTVMTTARTSPENPAWLELPFNLPCLDAGDPGWGVSNVYACDNGKGVGTPGFMDGKCQTTNSAAADYDAPCPILVTLRSVKLRPATPDLVEAEVVLVLDASKDITTRKASRIYVDSEDSTSACVWVKRLGCWADFHSAASGRKDETVSARVRFKLDAAWGDLMAFEMVPPDSTKPDELIGGLAALEADDIGFGGTNRCLDPACDDEEDMCDYACNFAKMSFVKGLIVDYVLKPQLQGALKTGLAQQQCRPCNPADATVAACPSGSTCQCASGTTCEPTQKVCMGDKAHGSRCVPRLLGYEGRVKLGEMLQALGGDPATKLDLFAAAGGTAPELGPALQTAVVAGARAVEHSPCVPELPAPAPQTVPPPSLESDGPAGYHVGLALSQHFLNGALHEAHQSGALCMNLASSEIPSLSSGIFKIALPSLGVVAGSATGDAPMMVVLRPLANPTLEVGEGTYDPVTKKPIKPLLTVGLNDLRIDIYALVEDRYVRLFTIGADVRLPVSLVVEGCPMTLLPALGDLKQMIVIRKDVPGNAELLAEDPAALTQLIPMILGMAEPLLSSALKPITVPDMNGFRVHVDDLRGVTRIGSSDQFHYLGLYGRLGLAGQCQSWGPKASARLVSSRLPAREDLVLRADRPLPWPKAVLEVSAEDLPGKDRKMEYAYRVDGGLWSTWFDGPRLEVEHPALLASGRHRLEVRARIAGEATMVGTAGDPVVFLSDWEPPRVRLVEDRAAGTFRVEAKDDVSATSALAFAYRVGDGRLSEFGPARPVDLAAVEAAGTLEVQVRDEAGHVGTAVWKAPQTPAAAAAGDEGGERTAGPSSLGCSAAGPGLPSLLLAGLPLWLRRRRRG